MNLELSSQHLAQMDMDGGSQGGAAGAGGLPRVRRNGILTLEVLGSRGEPQAQLEVLQGGSPGATRRDGGRAPVGSEFSTGLCWALNARPRCHHAQEPHRRGGALSVITPRSLTAHASGGHAV